MSRYDLFRRRIAPIAFFIALALIARETCQKNHRTHATVELVFEARETVRAVEVLANVGEDTIASFRRTAQPGALIGPCQFELSTPEDDGELVIEVDRGPDRQQRLTRRFHAIEGATIRVEIPARGN